MAADDPVILGLVEAILDGDAPDWTSVESAATDSQRAVFTELQAIAAIGSAWRRGRIPSFHSPLHLASAVGSTWGQLRILEALGHGGFGTVYRAWDPQLDREVALKLLPAGDDAVSALEEGRLLAKVHHRNVVTIFGADRIGPYFGLGMELVHGETLEHVLVKEGLIDVPRVVALGRQLCEALAAVHRAGLVHRDVKAHNVMLEPSGRLVLMDFGAGRFLSKSSDQEFAGTPLYLAPEIFGGAAATAQSDLYSAGVLLYHLLTGRYPVEGRTLREVRDVHSRLEQRSSVRLQRPDLPRRLASAIDRALAIQPVDRFQTAESMAAALGAESSGRTRVPYAAALLGLATVTAVAVAYTTPGRQFARALSGPSFSSLGRAAISPETPTARRLSLPRGSVFGSGLSYDGRYFSFADRDSNLAVFDMSTGQTETLVRANGDQYAEFSIVAPDGKLVAYQWWTDRRTYEIRLVDRATKSVRTLLRDDDLDYPLPIDWAKDGSKILVWTRTTQRVGRIMLADVTSGKLQVVREINAGVPLGLSLSTDGRYVAYDLPLSEDNQTRAIHIVDTMGIDDRIPPTEKDANDRFPLWTPDGQRLFFISDRSGSADGWLVPVRDGEATAEPTLVVRNLGRVESLGLTWEGAFYYRLTVGAFDVNEITLDPATMLPLSKPRRVAKHFAASNIGPSYSPDGRQLAYISIRDGLGGRPTRTIVVHDFETGAERELNPPLDLGTAPARWSPEGRRLLVGASVIDVGTGAVVPVVNRGLDRDLTAFGPTRWASDGTSVLYEQERTGVVKHSLAGRPDEVVYAYGVDSSVGRIHRFEVSPDGQRLAFSAFLRDGNGSVLRVVTPGGAIELARRMSPEMITVQAWSSDGRFILFTTLRTGAPPPHELWRVPAWGGPPEHLTSIAGATQLNPMAFNPKGTALAYTTGTPLQELWMMEHFLPKPR
ncbi:MAG: hypothetical protein C5B57_09800 [Blastocatellia bacterium]|nr:MAG: hypothetical protein C5B57_09800 [Blastocatellia bacterium]